MSHNTQAINKTRQNLSEFEEIWLFGYGSLIYKVDFPILDQSQAYIQGWTRRFWQGSHDHRGTPEKPGRVLTLINAPDEICHGMAYRVSHEVFDHLDHREKNGYLRFETDLVFNSKKTIKGLVYIAPEDNDAFLGPASEQQIAQHIFNSKGPSGENKEYVLKLAKALRQLNLVDSHVFAIETWLNQFETETQNN
ncbi:gamma-glutamylcyclotransferase [Aliikangiella maris]|uniref:glutathione-specific gamma-glutamylcyclotransferase n=2 Tax=Aliikangiella maris TaxID=3162458 RepID=A0ABV3MSH8_9GAMM